MKKGAATVSIPNERRQQCRPVQPIGARHADQHRGDRDPDGIMRDPAQPAFVAAWERWARGGMIAILRAKRSPAIRINRPTSL
jgi:hypothetical protein